MKNKLIQMYNFQNPQIQFKENTIYIIDNNQKYRLEYIDSNANLNTIKQFYEQNNLISTNKIIRTNTNEIVFKHDFKDYILTKIEKDNKNILEIIEENLSNINLYSTNSKNKEFSDWFFLWISKNDNIIKIYKLNNQHDSSVDDTIMYYIGMAENAITYYNTIKNKTKYEQTISHRRAKDFENPLNIIIDQKERDIGEYIKLIFLEKKIYQNQFNEICKIIQKYNLSYEKVYARLLYPTFYFDELEVYFKYKKKSKKLDLYIKRIDEYEKYLKLTNEIFSKNVIIKKIDWIN